MKKLIKAGYGCTIQTRVVSIHGIQKLSYWGYACPLWWISPSYDMESILRNGAFVTGLRVVMAQENTLENLENRLLEKAKDKFPNPFELSNGGDARKVYPEIYY